MKATNLSTEELLDRERKARVDAEAAQQRLQFLFQATSALFARPLTGASKLNTLAQLAVPHVADWCLVDIVNRGDALSRVAATHWDPARASAATHLVGRFGYDPAAPAGAGFAMRTGTAQIIDDLTESAGLVSASDSLRVLHGLGAKSVALVPLMGTQAPLGVVSFAFAESHRSYSSEELELLQDLCARAAWAVENAMLHEQTQRAVRARDDLLAVVSHDLRNPLSTISMAANLLRKGADNREKTLRNAERIGRAAGQMERLISDLLDLAAIESAHLRVEQSTWRVATLVAEAMELMGPLARERQLQLQAVVADGEANVMCNRDRTLQVFSNLIGNAVKFTPQGGTITVRVEPEERVVRVSVEDTGPGIPPEQLPHIFNRYWQARRSDRRGVGLGLSIANGIIAAQGGRIWVESTVGSGTAFRFTLRRAD